MHVYLNETSHNIKKYTTVVKERYIYKIMAVCTTSRVIILIHDINTSYI